MEPKRRSKTVAALGVAGAVLVVALVAALIVSAVAGDDDEGQAAAPATSSATAPPPEPEAEEPTGDETTDVDPTGRELTVIDSTAGTPREQTGEPGDFPAGQEMVGAPEGLELQRVTSGTTLMVSTSDGPTSVEDNVMTGYAHSPAGAALLAANYQGLGLEMGHAYADLMEHFAAGLVAEDPELLDEVRARGDAAGGDALAAAEGYQAPRWFKFGQCDADFCTVEAAMPSVADAVGQVNATDADPNEHPVFRVSMKWADDQWEIISGRSLPPITDIDGSWSQWN